MKIGIIGAENSHTAAIAKTINVEKLVKGFSVDYVWGETEEYAKEAAKAGKIQNIVINPKQMLGKIDAVLVDHRHPKYHLKAVFPFIEQGIPTFVDKPFCYRASEGKEFLKTARKNKASVTSFSIVPEQQSFRRFITQIEGIGNIRAGTTYGPCDLKSEYGGVFFYGIHQVDMALHAFGYNVSSVFITANCNGATGQLLYSDGKIVTVNFIKEGCLDFSITAVGTDKIIHQAVTFDNNPYLPGIKVFTGMFKTGKEPVKYEHILKPVQVLEAMERSIRSKQIEKVCK